jgi:flagellar basal-body rod modification protein FlgD
MEITPTSAATASAAARTSENEASAGALAADFQTFLTLLTTQMRNQDPLKPMESTEFVAQLAAFSGVEQQVRANDRLDAMLELLGGGGAGLAEWIGREVRAPGKAAFAGEPVEIGTTPVEGADKAWLVVRNDFDQVVARLPVDPASETVEWDGTDNMGTELPHGRYGVAIESWDGETLLDTQAGTVFAAVKEVRIADGQQVLVLDDGSRVTIDQVTAVR